MKDEENYILDLRDMPLFFEDLGEQNEESYIPLSGAKRIDGLSATPPIGGEQSGFNFTDLN
jgi:hypothetical protein